MSSHASSDKDKSKGKHSSSRGGAGRSRSDSDSNSKSSSSSRSDSKRGTVSGTSPSPSMSLIVEDLYKIYEKINSAEDKSTVEDEYRVFIGCVSKSDQEKRLVSQFIPRFLDSFVGL